MKHARNNGLNGSNGLKQKIITGFEKKKRREQRGLVGNWVNGFVRFDFFH